MKRTTRVTILAMSLALGASRADVPAGTSQPEQHGSVANRIQPGAEGATAANDPAERQPVRLDWPGNADREKPLILMAPHLPASRPPPFPRGSNSGWPYRHSIGYESVLQGVPAGCKIAPSC
jgi:hypothetical protein